MSRVFAGRPHWQSGIGVGSPCVWPRRSIDHVVPKRLGGGTTWDNVVTACRRCNMRKSDKPLHQSGMSLRRTPRQPRYIPYISLMKYLTGRRNEVWRDYLPVFADFRD